MVAAGALGAVAWQKKYGPDSAAAASNILRADYVGSQECQSCHEEAFADWKRHPHGRMNQNPTADAIRGDFSGITEQYARGQASFTTEGGQYFMTLSGKNEVRRRYRVTRTVGGIYTQFYIGVMVEGPEPKDSEYYSVEHKLPFGYWHRLKRWMPYNYFDPVGPELEADGTPKRDVFSQAELDPWKANCMLCHNTWPWLYRNVFARESDRGYPRPDQVVSKHRLWNEVATQVDLSKATEVSTVAFGNALQPEKDLVELGIACEACHLGGRAHVTSGSDVSGIPTSTLHGVLFVSRDSSPEAAHSFKKRGMCSECHSSTGKLWPNGGSAGNSREAIDLSVGACKTELTCVHCHSPHAPPDANPLVLRGKSISSCATCHKDFQKPEHVVAHSGHGADAKVDCLDCHMPRMSGGVSSVVHTHFISSPSNEKMLAAGSPNACNLCHLDKSVRWTVEQLNAKWKLTLKADEAWAKNYVGGLDAPLGPSWLKSEEEENRLVAGAAYGRKGPSALPHLIPALEDTAAVNRVFAGFAVEDARGRPLTTAEYDPAKLPAERAKQIEALLQQLSAAAPDARPAAGGQP